MAILKMCSRCRTIISVSEKLCINCTEKQKKDKNEYDKTRDRATVSFYNSRSWKVVKEIVKDRDNNLCLVCLELDRIAECNVVHHVVEVKQDWNMRLDKDNCISLCHDCHNKVHSRYRDKDNRNITQKKLFNLIKK